MDDELWEFVVPHNCSEIVLNKRFRYYARQK